MIESNKLKDENLILNKNKNNKNHESIKNNFNLRQSVLSSNSSVCSIKSRTPSIINNKNYFKKSLINNLNLEDDIFENIVELECLIYTDFSIERLSHLTFLYMELIDYYTLLKQSSKAYEYQLRMHSKLSDSLILKKLNDINTQSNNQSVFNTSFSKSAFVDLNDNIGNNVDINSSFYNSMIKRKNFDAREANRNLDKQKRINSLKFKLNNINKQENLFNKNIEVKDICINKPIDKIGNIVSKDISKQSETLKLRLENRKNKNLLGLSIISGEASGYSPINSTKSVNIDRKLLKLVSFKSNINSKNENNLVSKKISSSKSNQDIYFSNNNNSFISNKSAYSNTDNKSECNYLNINNKNNKNLLESNNINIDINKHISENCNSVLPLDINDDEYFELKNKKEDNLNIIYEDENEEIIKKKSSLSEDNINDIYKEITKDNCKNKINKTIIKDDNSSLNLNNSSISNSYFKNKIKSNWCNLSKKNKIIYSLKIITNNFIKQCVKYYNDIFINNLSNTIKELVNNNFKAFEENIKECILNIRELELKEKDGKNKIIFLIN